MIQVSYKKEANCLNYCSHRRLSFGERVIVEQYLLTNIAVKTEYYKKHPALFNYSGIDGNLTRDLNQFHLKNTIKTLKEKDLKVEQSVKDLIDQSMAGYYFERIGNTILEVRQAIKDPLLKKDLTIHKSRLRKLVEAYNTHVEKHVKYCDVIPKELKPYL